MAKQTANFRRIGSGLLIKFIFFTLLFALGISVFAQSNVRVSWEYMKSLRVKSSQEFIFSASEGQFYLDIEGVTPENIYFSVERLPDSVSFVSSKKETLLANISEGREKNGTRIILWFKFSEAGNYKLPALYVKIGKYSTYSIPFEQVTVYMNPKTISPKVGIQFENESFVTKNRKVTVPLGDHIRFTVTLQYAVNMVNFRWALPENSIFQEVTRYPVTVDGNIGTTFTPDIVPIVTFDWKPLEAGIYTFPQIIVTATGYNGNVIDLSPDEYKFTVKTMSAKKPDEEDSSVEETDEFEYAFYIPYIDNSDEVVQLIGVENIQQMLEARQNERHGIPFFSSAREERKELEKSLGINEGVDEPSEPMFYILLGLSLLIIVGAIILVIFKKIHMAVFVFVIAVFMSFGTTVHGIRTFTPYALFIGSEVSPIPEENAMSGVTVQPGSRVKIAQRAGDWVYIGYNDTFGWVKEDSICLIR